MSVVQGVVQTPFALAKLKQSWIQDPDWNLEDTPGFALHRAELLEFSCKHAAKEAAQHERERQSFATKNGVTIEAALRLLEVQDGEARSMESAIRVFKHVYRQAGGSDYSDMDADFGDIVGAIANVAAARVEQAQILATAKPPMQP